MTTRFFDADWNEIESPYTPMSDEDWDEAMTTPIS